MGLTPRDHTAATLKRMNLAGSVPGNLDRDKDATGDNYGLTAARGSDASSFALSGAPKSPHMGRPGRATGGRLSGSLQRTRRTPQETADDIANEDRVANELAKDRESRARGGRTKGKTTVNVIIGGDKHLPPQMPPPMPPPPMAAPGPVGPPPGPPPGGPPGGAPPMGPPPGGMPPPGMPPMARARGGRIGKQWGGGTAAGGMPPPPGAGMPPPGMGAPPPGGMPPPGAPPMMRAKGGRIEISTPGVHDYGKAGVKHGSTREKYGGGSGLGRMENARHQK